MRADPQLTPKQQERFALMETLGRDVPDSYLRHAVLATSQYDDVVASLSAEVLRLRRERAEPVAVPSPAPTPPTCQWTEDSSGDYWESECGQTFCFNNGTPADNKMTFCCGCGKPLVWQTAVEAVDGND